MIESSEDEKINFAVLLKLIVQFIKPFKVLLLLTIILNGIFSFLNAISIGLVKPIFSIIFNVENQVETEDLNFLENLQANFYDFIKQLISSEKGLDYTLLNLSFLIIFVFILKNFFKYLGSVYNVKLEEGIIKYIRDKVFSNLTSLSVDFFTKNKEGSLISIISNDVLTLNSTTISSLTILWREFIQILLFLILLLGISIKLTLIAFSTSIISFVLIRYSIKFLRRYASRMQTAMADYTSTIQETVSGIRVVKAYNAEELSKKRFFKDTDKYVKSAIKHQKIISLIPSMSEILAISALSIVLVVGGQEVISGLMAPDNLMAFLFFLFAIMSPITTVINSIAQWQRGLIAAGRVSKILNAKSSIESGEIKDFEFNDQIEFRKVSFSYDKIPVLKDVSFKIPKGKKVALVGPSGSGKSTVLDLLIRFYDPTNGTILIDGSDIRNLNIAQYRSKFGIVAQESMLFNDSITNNISFGYGDVKFEEIERAAKYANAYEFIMKLPSGFDTNIGDRGVLLSGGEKQRISIARALVRNPEIIIFDEATSALDAESEKVVQEAINEALKDRTAIIVAHRLSTIIDCDEIIVFDKGKIVEKGNHLELMSNNGLYRKLYEIQFSRQEKTIEN